MNKQTVAVLTVAILGFLFAFAIPQVISATDGPQTTEIEVSAGDSVTVTDGLQLEVNDTTNTEVDLSLEDSETRQTDAHTIGEGNTSAYSLPGGSGNVTVVETSNQRATLDVDYSPTYGWGAASTAVADNLGLILIILAFVVVVGGMKVVIA